MAVVSYLSLRSYWTIIQLCGAYYGIQGIPVEWVNQLHRIDDIQLLTQQLIDAQLSKRLMI